jgi:hypothetical protein
MWTEVYRSISDTTAALDDIVTMQHLLVPRPYGSLTTIPQRIPIISPFANATIASSSASSSLTTAASATANNAQHQLKLRFDWTSLSPRSPLAVRMMQHQANCDLPLGYFRYRNRFGLGSDLHVYSQALCNAMEQRASQPQRLELVDVELCNNTASRDETAMSCISLLVNSSAQVMRHEFIWRVRAPLPRIFPTHVAK